MRLLVGTTRAREAYQAINLLAAPEFFLVECAGVTSREATIVRDTDQVDHPVATSAFMSCFSHLKKIEGFRFVRGYALKSKAVSLL